MFWAEKSPTSQKANPLDLDVKFIKFHIQIAIQVFCVVLSVDFEVPSTHATTQMFFHLTASTTTRTSVHFSLGNSIFTLHACMTSVPTKLQQARKNGTAQMRDFWNVDHVAAVQLWDGGHYSSSSLTHSLLTMRKHDMSGSKHLMWNPWTFTMRKLDLHQNAQYWKDICQPGICFPSLCRTLCASLRLENLWVGAVRGLKMGSTVSFPIVIGMIVTYQPEFHEALISGGSLNPPKSMNMNIKLLLAEITFCSYSWTEL